MTQEQVTQPDLSALLGDESRPIIFPNGLIGLEEWHKFTLITHPAGGPLQLLQSLEDERASFIVANPHQIMADYQLKLAQADVDALEYAGGSGIIPAENPHITPLCILSVQEEPFLVSANLLGPLVINWQTGLGRQMIQSDSNYSPRYVITNSDSAQPAVKISPDKEGV